MNLLRKTRTALRLIKEGRFHKTISAMVSRPRLAFLWSTKPTWKTGINSEIQFWDKYFCTKGLHWAESYGMRLDPDLPLQPRPAALLPTQTEVQILDVGAGPLTHLGKKHNGKRLNITAVDPLADEYDKILDRYQVQPLVRTQKLAAENLRKRFSANTFDLVIARNCIDHAYDPGKAIMQMIEVVKRGGYVLLEHRPNEAEHEKYLGFHQWNFSLAANGAFIISSKRKIIDMTKKCSSLCLMKSEIVNEGEDGDWLITRIQKI